MSYVRPGYENSDCPEAISFITTGGGVSLLESTINESQVQVVVVRG